MSIVKAARRAASRVLGPRLTALARRAFQPKLDSIADYRTRLQGKRSLEIGGPSALLARDGPVPVYDVLASLDNVLFSTNTIWTGGVREGGDFFYQIGKRPGTQFICEAVALQSIQSSGYESVLACHCLEHIANPLRALAEWKRVLKDEGLLLLVLPHKDGTFDWRRPATPLAHMMADYENAMGDDDLTHLSEILALHDLSRDREAGTKEQFRERCLANYVNRAMHHHVFDTRTALATVDQAGFRVVRVDTLKPHHIIILAASTALPIDNSQFLKSNAEHWSRSPFPSDHEQTIFSRARKALPDPPGWFEALPLDLCPLAFPGEQNLINAQDDCGNQHDHTLRVE
jgi:SAM-dependent methyltransferase